MLDSNTSCNLVPLGASVRIRATSNVLLFAFYMGFMLVTTIHYFIGALLFFCYTYIVNYLLFSL